MVCVLNEMICNVGSTTSSFSYVDSFGFVCVCVCSSIEHRVSKAFNMSPCDNCLFKTKSQLLTGIRSMECKIIDQGS